MSKGMQAATGEVVILFDADLKQVIGEEIKTALSLFIDKGLDMLIMQNTGTNKIDTILRKDIVLSGKRIMSTPLLKEVFKEERPFGYQLEIAINHYCLHHAKQCAWTQSKTINLHKIAQKGFVEGLKHDRKMNASLYRFKGMFWFYKHLMTFCRTRVEHTHNFL